MRSFRFPLAWGRGVLRFLEGEVVPHIPLVVLITLFVLVLHKRHLLDVTDSFFMPWAVQAFLHEAPPTLRSDPREKIQVVEAAPAMRIEELEMSRVNDRHAIDRVGGVRPVDRAKLAQVLEQLAGLLERRSSRGPGALPQVIAIDVDVTPLGPPDDTAPMLAALSRLRKHATVIALAMERPSREQRAYRNRFMVEAGCTPSKDVDARGVAPGAGRQPLHFASPGVFPQRYANYEVFPMDFPFAASSREGGGRWQPAGLHFPSLSNLVHFSLQPAAADAAVTRTLSLLCDQAADAPADALLLQDIIMQVPSPACEGPARPPDCDFSLKPYQLRGTNWGLQNTDLVGWMPLESSRLLQPAGSPQEAARTESLLDAGALIFSIDGGASHDKFRIPSFSDRPVSGATVQALQAVSARPGMDLNRYSPRGLLVDFAIGILFLLAWRPLRRLGPRLPAALRPIFHALVPLALAVLVFQWFIHWVAPRLVGEHFWVNPAYVLAGLLLHAYVEGLDQPDARKHQHALDLTFGITPMLHAFHQRQLPRGEALGVAAATALAWLVLGAGGWYVAGLGDSGPVIVCAAALIVAGAIALDLGKGNRHAPRLQHP